MDDELFPNVARHAGWWWEMDFDTYDHRSRNVPNPNLTATDPAPVGRLFGPDGRSYRDVHEPRTSVPFGFHPDRSD